MLGLINAVTATFGAIDRYVKQGLVMANRFLTPPKLTFPANGSAEFDGSSDYILIKEDGKGSAFDTQEFTIGAWFYSDLSNTYNVIWSYDFTSQASPYYSQHVRVFNDGKIDLAYNIGSNYQFTQSATGLVSANNWHYISVTFESGSQKIYLDGSEVKATTNSGAITYYNTPVIIGKSPNYSGFLEGNLSNVAFWNRALSSDEINSVMWKGYEALTSGEKNGLQAWYKLEESELFDASNTSTTNLEEYAKLNSLTFEGKTCLQTALDGFPDITDARLYSANYDIRVSADGGTVESLNCVETELNALL